MLCKEGNSMAMAVIVTNNSVSQSNQEVLVRAPTLWQEAGHLVLQDAWSRGYKNKHKAAPSQGRRQGLREVRWLADSYTASQ